MNSTLVKVLRRRHAYDALTAKAARAISCNLGCAPPYETASYLTASYHSLPRGVSLCGPKWATETDAWLPFGIRFHASQSQPLVEKENHGSGIQISKAATSRLERLRDESSKNHVFLRLSVEGGGCSGFSYEFTIEDNPPAEDDLIFEAATGAAVVCDAVSYEFLRGATIDFESNLMRSAFVVSRRNHNFVTFFRRLMSKSSSPTIAGSGQSKCSVCMRVRELICCQMIEYYVVNYY